MSDFSEAKAGDRVCIYPFSERIALDLYQSKEGAKRDSPEGGTIYVKLTGEYEVEE